MSKPSMLSIGDRLHVPVGELQFDFVRSSGPGGQNVNKVNTKAILRWMPTANTTLPLVVRERFLRQVASRLTAAGEIVITSQRYRDQGRNVADCLEKLRQLIARAAVEPKRRKQTRPTRASVERRLSSKREASNKKQTRRAPEWES